MKYIFISKNWYGDKIKKEETVHIQDIDLALYLANMEETVYIKFNYLKDTIKINKSKGEI